MRYRLTAVRSAIAALVVLASVSGVQSEEPHLEFVRGLRARGLPDLALEYLEKLRQKPPGNIGVFLPLEIGKTRLEIAMAEPDLPRRTVLQNQARADLQAFIRTHPSHALAAEAAFEIAHIASLQGQSQLSGALQIEDKEAQRVAFAKARLQFEEAGRQLQAAADRIGTQLEGLAPAATSQGTAERASLTQARLRADLEQGINLLRQAQTYAEQGEETKRAEILKKAMEQLTGLASQRESMRNPLGWQALAWLGYAQLENEDPKAARKIFAEVIADSDEQAEAGRRLARYFRLQAYAKDSDVKNPAAQIQQAAEEWLRIYPDYSASQEGYGVRFQLANAYLAQAVALAKQQNQRARDLYEKALRLFQALEQTQNEFTARAHEKKLNIILAVSQERTRGDIRKLKDFQECYLRAQLEMARLNEDTKKADGTAKTQEQREQHFKNIVLALSRAVELADNSVSAQELDDVRYLLAYGYLVTGDYYRAAVWGEELARTRPTANHAPLAAAYALRSYGLLVAEQEQAGVRKEELAPLRARMHNLADYIERKWPADAAADIARHALGMIFVADSNWPQAVAVLERITAAYSDSTRPLYQLAIAALQADKENMKPAAGQQPYRERARAALLRIPDLTGQADPGTVQTYFAAKLLLANMYYQAKEYEKLEALADLLARNLDTFDEKTKSEQGANVRALKLYAELGRAETDYTGGRYAKAREVVDPVVERMLDPAQANASSEKDPRLLRAVLALALRANIQDGKLDRGRRVVELLQKRFPESSVEILIQFVQQLNDQVQQLRARGDPAKPDLDKTIANFSAFLDELAKQQEKKPKPEMVLFLARSYSSLDNHSEAAALANTIEAPAAGKADTKASQLYHVARILYARELRLAKDFDAAAAALKNIQIADWGQNNLEVRKERVFLLEDQEKYAGKEGAILAWNSLMQQLRPRLNDNKIKDQYFECYYHLTECIFRNALKMTDPAKKARDIGVAASFITKLEEQPDSSVDTVKQRFAELLQREPLLKEKYEEVRKRRQ